MKKGIIHKALVIAVAATFALSMFAGCANSNKVASSSVPAVATEQKVLTVSVTLSKEFIDGVNSLSNHLGNSSSPSSNSSSKLPDGIIKITKNKDGSETMVMTKAKYNEMMKGMKDSLNASIKQLTSSSSSTGVKSFKSITANDKMDDFKVVVEKESYTNSMDGLSLLGLYMGSGLYQEFNNVSSPKVTFHIIDSKDNKEFKTLKYPDDLKSSSSPSSSAKTTDTKKTISSHAQSSADSKSNTSQESKKGTSSFNESEFVNGLSPEDKRAWENYTLQQLTPQSAESIIIESSSQSSTHEDDKYGDTDGIDNEGMESTLNSTLSGTPDK